MKKLVAMLLALMLLSLTACGNSGGTQVSSVSESSASAAQNENSPTGSESESAPVSDTESDTDTQEETDTSSDDISQAIEEAVVSTVAGGSDATSTQGGKVLVAYFSRVDNAVIDPNVDAVTSASVNLKNGDYVGNSEIIAEMAVSLTSGDLFSIKTVKTYPSAYRATTDVAMDEQKANARPELSTHVENIKDYDTIILIYPNWWGTIPNALYTFLEEYDFSGKTIAAICTHEGSGLGSSISDIKELCPNATIPDGLAIRGSSVTGAQQQVEKWISGLDSLK